MLLRAELTYISHLIDRRNAWSSMRQGVEELSDTGQRYSRREGEKENLAGRTSNGSENCSSGGFQIRFLRPEA